MSYIYSQALVAAFSEANCSDIDASALLRESHMLKPSWLHDKTMEPSRHSRFGMTYAHLTESHGAELLMLFAADSLAKILALPEMAQDLMESDPVCGQKWQGSLAKYDPATHSLKTAQLSLLEDLTGCCVTLPKWGLMRNGELFQQPTPALSISENASGFSHLFPTPCAAAEAPNLGSNSTGPKSLIAAANTKWKPGMVWQTPVADDSASRAAGKWNSRGEPKLSAQVMIPTPTVCGNYNRKGLSATSGDGLATFVQNWPTPTAKMDKKARGNALKNAQDTIARGFSLGLPEKVAVVDAKTYPTATATATAYKGWSPNHNRAQSDDRLDYTVERESFQPGQQTPPMRLNPDWVEWLMGWPIGHTDLKPLGTDKFQEWQRQHSPCCTENKEAA